jgi:transposase
MASAAGRLVDVVDARTLRVTQPRVVAFRIFAGAAMPTPPLDIRMIKDVLRLKLLNRLTHQTIASSLSISKGVVTKYLTLAQTHQLDWPSISELTQTELEHRLLGDSIQNRSVVLPDFARMHVEMRRKGVTLTLLWDEYCDAHPGQRVWGRSQFFDQYKKFCKTLKRSMRQSHRAGEKLFVDFAGPTLGLADGTRGQVFVAAMGASSYTFACVTADQTMRSWLAAIARALSFMGGVPQLIVPDNARALIADPDRYEPRVGDTVLDFARHYGVSFLPARPYSPQDKGKVESAVQVVERWILARLRHVRLDNLAAADAAVSAMLADLNQRRFQKIDSTRANLFAQLDAPALAPLPMAPWRWASWRSASVHIDYHIEIDAHRYSVPHQLVGIRVEVRLTDALVEVLHRGERVAIHARNHRRGGYTTIDEHMPAAHRAHKEWTPERLIHWGGTIGPHTAAFVQSLLTQHRHPEHGYRRSLGLLSLAKRYGHERLEAACRLAIELNAIYYRHVRDILENGRDLVPQASPNPWSSPQHENVRGATYYH